MMDCRTGLVTTPALMDTDGSSRQAPDPGAVDIHTSDNPFSLERSCDYQQLHIFFRFPAGHINRKLFHHVPSLITVNS